MLIGVSGNTCEKTSVTPLKVTVSVCAVATPVRLIVIVLLENIGAPFTVPTPPVTLALPLTRLFVNVTTMV
jgi:hypothetical protein